MKQIRIGKDITVRWPILSNGAAVKLEGRDLTLFVRPPTEAERCIGFSTEDNIIIFTIPGTDQMALGTYSITLWENYGKKGQTAVDVCEAFRLVSTTCKECGKDDGLTTETVDLNFSNLEVSVQGLPGFSPIIEEAENTPESYRLKITTAKEQIVTPNLHGRDFTYKDFTAEQLAALQRPAAEAAGTARAAAGKAHAAARRAEIAAGNAGGIIVCDEEHIVGMFCDETGCEHPIYENTFILDELPAAVGATKDYVLASEPLGFGRYIHVVGVEIALDGGEAFCFSNYAVTMVYVAALQTHCVLRCIAPADNVTKAVLRMRYIKYFGDLLRFCVTLPEGVDAHGVGISVAPLKYDKRIAFTYTADDSVVGAYSRIWRRINRKWIDDVEFHHLGAERTTGYIPDHPLVMTDGCGNDRRFGFSTAIWPNWRDEWHPDGRIGESSVSTTNIYITWEELRMMSDFGVSVLFHNVDETRYDKNNPDEILQGFIDDNEKTKLKLNREMKVMGLPDGNSNYVTAAAASPLVQFSRSSLSGEVINLHTCGDLLKKGTYGGDRTSDIESKLAELATQHDSDNPYWVGITQHRVSLEMMQMLETVYERYGKGGDDSVWVASWDEIYEYVAMREGMTSQKTVNGQTVTFDICLPANRAFYFRDISFLLSGIASAEGVTITPLSENIKGAAHAAHTSRWTGEKCLLLNMNFNADAEDRAEKYTARYEASGDASDKEDALYFASQLLPELAAPYLARIDNDEPGPLQILGAAINDGAATTTQRDITIRLDVAGTPTHYRIAGTSDFEGAEWLTYVSTPSYQLSEGDGEKSIYIQVRNATSESNIYIASITLEEPPAGGFRALLSLGWDWSAGGSAGSTIYDQTLQAGRVRIGNDNAKYNIYDTSGTVIGSATIAGLKVPGSGNYGKVPGDNSGAYPDSLLKFCAYKPAANAEAVITMTLPVGEYRIRIFINTGVSTIDISQADYTLEHAGTVQHYPVEGTYYQNFDTVHELAVHVTTDDPVIIRLKTADPRNEVLYLNVVDIEQI